MANTGGKERGLVPEGWGDDAITPFLNQARANSFASYVHLRKSFQKLTGVASAFDLLRENLNYPEERSTPFFVLKSHASFLSAANLAMSGSTPESFMVMRGCLESALYGLYVSRNPGSMAVWAGRHDDADARNRTRGMFTIANMWACLAHVDTELRVTADAVYSKTIDHGAHPNVASLATATTITKHETKTQVRVAYLSADRAVIAGAMKSVAQVGVTALLVFQHAFKERYDLIGLTAMLPDLRKDL